MPIYTQAYLTTYTPVITLVGGAGNTVPVYTTNTGRYQMDGNRVYADIYFTGDGGAEGAGTGQVNISLPVTAGASIAYPELPCGLALNNATYYDLLGEISPSGTTIKIYYWSALTTLTTFTGADQNNATRQINISFNYEV